MYTPVNPSCKGGKLHGRGSVMKNGPHIPPRESYDVAAPLVLVSAAFL